MANPKRGDIVIYHEDTEDFRSKNNGAADAPAIVNRVWGSEVITAINITVFGDCFGTISKTSVMPINNPPQCGYASLEEAEANGQL